MNIKPMTDIMQADAEMQSAPDHKARDQGGACPACGGKVAFALVSAVLWEGDTLSVVRGVPALVCGACHDQFFADDTVMRLDLLRAGGFADTPRVTEMTVPVFAFPADTAPPDPPAPDPPPPDTTAKT